MLRSAIHIILSLLFILFAFSANSCDDDVVIGGGGEETPDDDDSDPDGDNPADDDADGLSNEVENTFVMPPRIADADHDGFNDGLEFVSERGDPLNANLTPTPEARSRILTATTALRNDPDRDRDGLGDTFEISNSLDPNDEDTDNDGYQDGLELVANSNPFDSESRPQREAPPASDGVNRTGNPPADSDFDGLSDSVENLNGSLANDSDTDGDGFSDGIEFLMGSDATDFLSVPNFNVPAPPVDDTTSDETES